MDKPDAKPPNINWFFFSVVAMELILMSVEQSLRLLLLLHYDIVRDDTNHTSHVLYRTVRNKSGSKSGIRSSIVGNVNALAPTRGIRDITEKEVISCLRRHDSSYTKLRYFQLNHQGKLHPEFGFAPREVQILHCLALALIGLNLNEMTQRQIGIIGEMNVVSEWEMTDELRELKKRLMSS